MIALLYSKLSDPQFMAMILVGIAAAATVFTVAMPLVEGDSLGRRMKAVALERDKIRARERERLSKTQQKVSLRQAPKAYMKQTVDRFKLNDWLGTQSARNQLVMAGYRGQHSEVAFLFFRLVMPIAMILIAGFYLFVLKIVAMPLLFKLGGVLVPCRSSRPSGALPARSARNASRWPRSSRSRPPSCPTWPSGGRPDENLGNRTGLEAVKSITTALIQAERYGTPLGQALRVLSQESRDIRMNEAEKKAAALPPKLTVPMILFFLPVLFVVIMTPALIQVFGWK